MTNYKKDFNDFVNELIKNMDYQNDLNNIVGVHFHSNQVIIEKQL